MATAEQLRRLTFLRDQLERSVDMGNPQDTLHLSQKLDALISEIMFVQHTGHECPPKEALCAAHGCQVLHLPSTACAMPGDAIVQQCADCGAQARRIITK